MSCASGPVPLILSPVVNVTLLYSNVAVFKWCHRLILSPVVGVTSLYTNVAVAGWYCRLLACTCGPVPSPTLGDSDTVSQVKSGLTCN